jgi:DNA-binding LacI/PurR family transcriptional regulator
MGFKYLYDLGHRAIRFLDRDFNSPDPAVTQRRAAYDEMMSVAGLPTDGRWVLGVSNRNGAERCAQLMAMPRAGRPTALLATDRLWDFIRPLLSAGVRVPEEISLLSLGVGEGGGDMHLDFDFAQRLRDARRGSASYPDRPTDERLTRIKPTTTFLPAEEMGELAIEEICRRLKDPAAEPVRRQLEPILVPGNTTAPPFG